MHGKEWLKHLKQKTLPVDQPVGFKHIENLYWVRLEKMNIWIVPNSYQLQISSENSFEEYFRLWFDVNLQN